MPIIKSAKKRLRQNLKRRAKNFPIRSKVKSVMKNALQLVKEGKTEEVIAYIPRAYSIIDTATKKNILHANNAARKKSRLAKALNQLQQGGVKKTEVRGVEKVDSEVSA